MKLTSLSDNTMDSMHNIGIGFKVVSALVKKKCTLLY